MMKNLCDQRSVFSRCNSILTSLIITLTVISHVVLPVTSSSTKPKIYLVSSLPFTQDRGVIDYEAGWSQRAVIDLLVEKINHPDNPLLPDYELKVLHMDGQCAKWLEV